MTQETPIKVLSLLGVALVSMAFTFAVTVSNASFTQVYNPIPQGPSPANVMAVLDNVSSSYSNIVYAQLVKPEAPGFAMAGDNLAFAVQGAGSQVANFLGLGPSSEVYSARPQVAGASTKIVVSKYYPATSGGGLGLFSLLMGNNN
jgi:hypothetical protein